jgi:hypothetical protein
MVGFGDAVFMYQKGASSLNQFHEMIRAQWQQALSKNDCDELLSIL